MLTQSYVQSILRYEEGNLFWIKNTRSRRGKGPIGTVNGKGYRQAFIDNKIYTIHRLVFLLHHGWLPRYLDHIDGNRLNNRIENLRPCSNQQNMFNLEGRATSGIKGVTLTRHGTWQAQLSINGRNRYLGVYKTIEEAGEIVRQAREKHHGNFARH